MEAGRRGHDWGSCGDAEMVEGWRYNVFFVNEEVGPGPGSEAWILA